MKTKYAVFYGANFQTVQSINGRDYGPTDDLEVAKAQCEVLVRKGETAAIFTMTTVAKPAAPPIAWAEVDGK